MTQKGNDEKSPDYLLRSIGKELSITFITEWGISGTLRSFNDKELCLDTKNGVVFVSRNAIAYYKRMNE